MITYRLRQSVPGISFPEESAGAKLIIIINDIYPGSSTHLKVVFREVLHQIELEFKSQF